MQELNRREDVDAALVDAVAVVYKHSYRCGVSLDARYEVESFARTADVPVYIVDVVASRAVSQYLTQCTAVPHHSPQVMVLRAGRCTWHASHHRVTAAALRREVGTDPPGG